MSLNYGYDSGYYSQYRVSQPLTAGSIATPSSPDISSQAMSRASSSATYVSSVSSSSQGSSPHAQGVVRKANACELLRKLCKDYMQFKLPSRADMNTLHSYSDVLDLDSFLNITYEVGNITGVGLRNGKVFFESFAEPPHDDLVNAFNRIFDNQVNPGIIPRTPFHSEGTKGKNSFVSNLILDIILPGYGVKQPDSQFRPRDQDPPNQFNSFQYQPGTTSLWPTIVVEVARTQSQPELIELMELYLSHQTQVNVFVGIKVFNDPLNRRVPKRWWMGVYIRQINPPAPSPALPGLLLPPRPVCVGQLAHPHHDLLTTPQNKQWMIPIDVLFFPIPIPPNPPSVPAGFIFPQQGLVLDVDQFREVVLFTT